MGIRFDVIETLTGQFLLMPSQRDGWRVLPNLRTTDWLASSQQYPLHRLGPNGKGTGSLLQQQGLNLTQYIIRLVFKSPRLTLLIYFLRTIHRSPTGTGNIYRHVALCAITDEVTDYSHGYQRSLQRPPSCTWHPSQILRSCDYTQVVGLMYRRGGMGVLHGQQAKGCCT